MNFTALLNRLKADCDTLKDPKVEAARVALEEAVMECLKAKRSGTPQCAFFEHPSPPLPHDLITNKPPQE